MTVRVYGINHIAIEVDDIAKAAAFYEDVFRDETQLAEVRDKVTKKYGLKLNPGFRCDFTDPFGNRIQAGIRFSS